MKKGIVFLWVLLVACEKPSDCITSAGATVTREVAVAPFTRLEIFRGIGVEIIQGPIYKVVLQSGENFIENIQVTQNGNVLQIRDQSTCNWVREFGVAKAIITAPNLEEVYSKSEQDVVSQGVLTYPYLHLYAMDKEGDGLPGAGTGDFRLAVNSTTLLVDNNNVSRYYISGTTQALKVNFWAGDGRLDAAQLQANTIQLYHRGSNDMLLYPTQSVAGSLVSTGNVELFNTPPLVNISTTYQGHVIYR